MIFPGAYKRKMKCMILGGSMGHKTRQRAEPTDPVVNGRRWAIGTRVKSSLCPPRPCEKGTASAMCFESLSKD